METVVTVIIFYGVFFAMQWPFLQRGQKRRGLFLVWILCGLGVSIAVAQGTQLPSPAPLIEKAIKALPITAGRVVE